MTLVQVYKLNQMVGSLLKLKNKGILQLRRIVNHLRRTLKCWSLTLWLTFTFKVPIGDLGVGDLQEN